MPFENGGANFERAVVERVADPHVAAASKAMP